MGDTVLSEKSGEGENYSSCFGGAMAAMRNFHAVARTGWNGKGMFLYLVPAMSYPSQTAIAKEKFGEHVPYQSYIAMKTVDDKVIPWVASQTDLLADDWFVVS